MKAMSPALRRKIIDALNHISADCDYQTWIKAGMSLSDFGPAGFDLWNQWSSTASGRYPGEADLRKRFAGFKAGKVTVGTLFYLSTQSGHTPSANGEGADEIIGATTTAGDASLQPGAVSPGKDQEAEQKAKIARAKSIWSNGWACSDQAEVYNGTLLNAADNTSQRAALRQRMHNARDAAFAYLTSRNLDHRWMPQLRIFLLNTAQKDDFAMTQKGAIAGLAFPMFNNGVLVGLQRLYFDAGGKKIHRMMLGKMGIMNISPLDSAQAIALSGDKPTLLWGEGFETCAGSVEASGLPCAVLYAAGQITARAGMYLEQSAAATQEQIAASPAIGLLVDKDNSNTGQNECFRAVQLLRKAGLQALYLLPPDLVKGGQKGSDWADVAEELGHAAAGKALMIAAQAQPHIPDIDDKAADEAPEANSEEPPAIDDHDYCWNDPDYLDQDDELALLNSGVRSQRVQNWRKVTDAGVSADEPAVTIHDAGAGREILKTGVQMLVDDYVQWLDKYRQAKSVADIKQEHVKLPEFRPYLFRPTTGAGKSSHLKTLPDHEKILEAGGAVRIFVATKNECDSFVEANPAFFRYHGRSPDPTSPGFCQNYEEMIKAVENGHIPQAEFCFNCKYGLKWSVERHGPQSEQGQKSIEKLAKMGITGEDLDALEPCVWQNHQRSALRHQFVVTTHHSYSENMATWHAEEGTVPTLACFDEDVPFSNVIEKITHEKVDEWARRNASNIRFIRHRLDNNIGDPLEFKEELRVAEASQETLLAFAQAITAMTGKSGRIDEGSPVWQCIDNLINLDATSALAIWEKLEFEKNGDLAAAPLRGAYAIAQTLKVNDGFVENGGLHVSAVRPVIERMGRFPTALFNATPSPVDESIIKAKNGIVVDVTVRQHVKITRRTNRFWGLKGLKMGGTDPKRLRREVRRYEKLIEHFADRRFIIHKVAQDYVDPEGQSPEIGHWGADHRAHNRFAGKNLVIAGSFSIPQQFMRHQYQAHRLAALTAGADPQDWPMFQDYTPVFDENEKERDDAFEHDCWINEGNGIEVKCFMPLPRQQKIREWFLKLCAIETVQAIGRARAVNASPDAPLDIDIFGGVPLYGLSEYGLVVDDYLDDPAEIGMTVDERNEARHDQVTTELNTAGLKLAAAGQKIDRKSMDAQVRADRVEAIEKQRKEEEAGVCGVSVLNTITETPQTPPAQGVDQHVYQEWLKNVGMPIFADAMKVNGRGAAAVRAAQEVLRNQPRADAQKVFQMLEEWASSVKDDGISIDEAAENDRDLPKSDSNYAAAAVYRKMIISGEVDIKKGGA
jgi:hypothetical protein